MTPISNFRHASKLTGVQKSAIMFLCLGEEYGSALMQQLDSAEIRKITKAISDMGEVSSYMVEEVMATFESKIGDVGGVVGSTETAKKLLTHFLPEDRVTAILDEIEGKKTGNIWEDLSALEPKILATYFLHERNQTIAVILAKLTADAVAKILAFFDKERIIDIVERMAKISDLPDEILTDLESGLRQEFLSGDSKDIESKIEEHLIKVFNKLDGEIVQRISTELEQKIPEKFRSIKQRMFVFDDMISLKPNTLALVMREAGRKTLPLALRGGGKEIRDHFLSSLPQRSRDMLQEEMKAMGPIKSRDAKNAQSELVEITMRLVSSGQIELPVDEAEEDLI